MGHVRSDADEVRIGCIPEMVATSYTLLAGTKDRITEVLAQFDRLVHLAMTISQVSTLRATEMKPKALC